MQRIDVNENEKIQYIQNLLRSKLNFLTRSTFKFVGDPIPPNSNINIKNVSPLVDESTTSKIDKDSLIFINETKVLNVDYCHISTLSNSIIKVNGKSINLNNAYNSFGFIFSSGPLFLQNMEKCILIAGCHQARLHNITDSIIIFENNEKDTQKTVIIENCRNVKFNSVYVDDFDHPTKFTESPNYQILQDDVVSEIENEIEKVELNDLTGFLKRFLSTSN
ncbi:uncharacterized protein KGF55_005016 [Candida pseudojiufengensis]|uniref:uncharacterized protein n=1 Tax=Candida pseudojiufengensis TaxID=497109 RepID=UPI0022246798|nr:uncharacterized protein KGF55_005016 [Candida pseudojiufengensis]KAI5959784.1 hypothetical protein KGF55_005016 [Candida pseudojiufengensis]